MQKKLMLLLGIGRIMLEDDYVGKSYRREIRRMGKALLRKVKRISLY